MAAIGAAWLVPPAKADDPFAVPAQAPAAEAAPATEAAPLSIPRRLEARCHDGSILIVRLVDAKIPIRTDYGRIEVPVGDIVSIEFATRLPDGLDQRIQQAIAGLGSTEFGVREAASAALAEIGALAYPAIAAASASDDPEVAHRAELLLDQLRAGKADEDYEVRDYDQITTPRSQFGGTIEVDSLLVETAPFGQQALKLNMLRRIAGDAGDPNAANALPDPGSLTGYQGQVGRTLYFVVSSAAGRGGHVWGTGTYTLDSSLQMAAVHSGYLQPGQTKVIGVTILGNQNNFAGSTSNGITSSSWNFYPGGFKFVARKGRSAHAAVVRPLPNAVLQR